MLAHDEVAVKRHYYDAFRQIASARESDIDRLVRENFAPDVRYFGSHPLDEITGASDIAQRVWRPLSASFRDLRRCDDILIGGHFQGKDWISATGYLHGTFVQPYLDIPATGNWAYLRYGEFHRIENGRILESYVIYDLPDLMRQAGVRPWRSGVAAETLMPGPASRDGVVLTAQDRGETRKSLELVEAMIFGGLLTFDGDDSASMGMERYWTPDMMWYGPGLIGATMGLDAFLKFHQEPWQNAVRPRGALTARDRKHVARFGDGPFCSFAVWPSLYATRGADLLGVPTTEQPVDIRVMDFYHRSGDRLNENWILIDFPHLFQQLGVDLFARMRESSNNAG
ncbi:MAG: ester cyclase [Rhizobiaceae bacterium]|nr:ester cyclase [Rhizobiaceae bacterium]